MNMNIRKDSIVELEGLCVDMTREELSPLLRYTSTGYIKTNENAGRGEVSWEIQKLDRVFEYSNWSRQIMVFRGTDNEEYLQMRPGTRFMKKWFWSTSESSMIASKFGEVMVEIILKKGDKAINVTHVSRHPFEKEILINRNTEFEVVSVDLIIKRVTVRTV